MKSFLLVLQTLVLATGLNRFAVTAQVTYPHTIQGTGYESSLNGQTVRNVQGVITAKSGTYNCYIQTPDNQIDNDVRTSEGLYVYNSNACNTYNIGDLIQIGSAKVNEYSSGTSNLHLTELSSTSQFSLIQSGANSASAVTVGGTSSNARTPPQMYVGNQNPFALPANQTTLESGSRANNLDVATYGADFWESLENMVITLPSPTVLGQIDSYGEVYVVPSGVQNPSQNSRGGLTLAANENATSDTTRWDSNPQAIQLIKAFDGTTVSPSVKLGDTLENVTGIVGYNYGVYTITPFTAPSIQTSKAGGAIASPFSTTNGQCNNLIVGTYNLDNLSPQNTTRITKIGGHIDSYLKDPDVMILNEIQDDDGPTDDGVVDANSTMKEIVSAIKGASYSYTYIDPVNDQDGGQPGGNIRPVLLYRQDHLQLTSGIPKGGSTDAVDVKLVNGKAQLTLNPGRIDPTNSAWKSSRKPLIGQFDLQDGSNQRIFVIGVQLTAKLDSTTPYQNPQAPINAGVDQRNAQTTVIHDFVQKILQVQSDAKVILLGDFNELSSVEPLNTLTASPAVLNEVLASKRVERYSYVFEQNCQDLVSLAYTEKWKGLKKTDSTIFTQFQDHLFVSPSIQASIWVPHVNTWAALADRASDHDPLVGKLNVC